MPHDGKKSLSRAREASHCTIPPPSKNSLACGGNGSAVGQRRPTPGGMWGLQQGIFGTIVVCGWLGHLWQQYVALIRRPLAHGQRER